MPPYIFQNAHAGRASWIHLVYNLCQVNKSTLSSTAYHFVILRVPDLSSRSFELIFTNDAMQVSKTNTGTPNNIEIAYCSESNRMKRGLRRVNCTTCLLALCCPNHAGWTVFFSCPGNCGTCSRRGPTST